MIVATRFWRDRRRASLGWAVGVVGVVLLTAALWPSVDGSPSFDDVIADLPDAVRTMIGAQAGVSLGSPPGYLNARIFATVLPVLLIVFGIGIGARAVAGSEEDGTLELILAGPVTRRQVALGRGATAAASTVLLAVIALGAVVVLGAPVGLLDGLSLGRLLAAGLGVFVLATFHAAIAFAVGAATGRHATAVGVAAAVAVAGYLLAGVLVTAGGLSWLRAISPWEWLLGRNVLVDGTPAAPLLIELGVGAVLVVIGVRRFERRDLR